MRRCTSLRSAAVPVLAFIQGFGGAHVACTLLQHAFHAVARRQEAPEARGGCGFGEATGNEELVWWRGSETGRALEGLTSAGVRAGESSPELYLHTPRPLRLPGVPANQAQLAGRSSWMGADRCRWCPSGCVRAPSRKSMHASVCSTLPAAQSSSSSSTRVATYLWLPWYIRPHTPEQHHHWDFTHSPCHLATATLRAAAAAVTASPLSPPAASLWSLAKHTGAQQQAATTATAAAADTQGLHGCARHQGIIYCTSDLSFNILQGL